MRCVLKSAKTEWYNLYTTEDTDKYIYICTEYSVYLKKFSNFCSYYFEHVFKVERANIWV